MVSVQKARKILGKDAEGKTDKQVQKIITFLEQLAKIAIDQVVKK
jgi:hypothetical protein